jgi:hypothetical protein
MAVPSTFLYDLRKADFLKKLINIDTGGDALKAMLLTASYTPNPAVDSVYADISANEVTGTNYTAGGAAVAGQAVTITAANSWSVARATSTAYTLGQVVRPAATNSFVYRCTVAGTTAADVAPTAATNASPAVVTAAANGLANGNRVLISGVTGLTNLNGSRVVNGISGSTYTLLDATTFAAVNGNGVFGGTPVVLPDWPTIVGQSITDGTVTWTCVGTSVVKWTCTNPSWASATITARYGVVYDTTVTNKLIACFDFGSNITSTNGTFTISLDANSGGIDLF